MGKSSQLTPSPRLKKKKKNGIAPVLFLLSICSMFGEESKTSMVK